MLRALFFSRDCLSILVVLGGFVGSVLFLESSSLLCSLQVSAMHFLSSVLEVVSHRLVLTTIIGSLTPQMFLPLFILSGTYGVWDKFGMPLK
ncbi:hypothetical protein ACE6H2_023338 [Prunus campanulata]